MNNCVLYLTFIINNLHYDPINNKNNITKIVYNICYYSEKRLLDPLLITALISHESSFKVHPLSKTEDIGLMQLNKKYILGKCDPYKIDCNIKLGTKKLVRFKKFAIGKHWLRRYNWRNKNHHLRVLWIREALREILQGNEYLFKLIRARKYQRIHLDYECIKENLCGQLKMEERS